jgi:hypothetical protein
VDGEPAAPGGSVGNDGPDIAIAPKPTL